MCTPQIDRIKRAGDASARGRDSQTRGVGVLPYSAMLSAIDGRSASVSDLAD